MIYRLGQTEDQEIKFNVFHWQLSFGMYKFILTKIDCHLNCFCYLEYRLFKNNDDLSGDQVQWSLDLIGSHNLLFANVRESDFCRELLF